jgi:hypothetical protein
MPLGIGPMRRPGRRAFVLTSLMVCQLMSWTAHADSAVSATEASVGQGLHDTGHAISRGAHATGHAISNGAHAVGHAFKRGTQRVHRVFDGTSSHNGSGSAAGSGRPTGAPAPPPLEPLPKK